MFNNIGGKIKALAYIACLIGIIACIIIGLSIISLSGMDEESMIVGIIVIIAGSFISWISSFVLYGYGQLIENSDQMVLYFQYGSPSTYSEEQKRQIINNRQVKSAFNTNGIMDIPKRNK